MAPGEAKEPLSITHVSELIAPHTKAQIYKISATLKAALEH
jgi:hypothetical protein